MRSRRSNPQGRRYDEIFGDEDGEPVRAASRVEATGEPHGSGAASSADPEEPDAPPAPSPAPLERCVLCGHDDELHLVPDEGWFCDDTTACSRRVDAREAQRQAEQEGLRL